MVINRSDLRLAITAGLATGFTAITPLPYGVYFTGAVLAVCTGTYGSSLAMARQRIAGTLLGGAVVLVTVIMLVMVASPSGLLSLAGALRRRPVGAGA